MSCVHLIKFKSQEGLDSYEIIYKYFINSNVAVAYHKVMALCFGCKSYCNSRLLACLHCIYFGCFRKHATEHATFNSHNLAVELSNGHVYCHSCCDYTYDSDIESISEEQRLILYRTTDSDSCPTYNGPTRYSSWNPTVSDTKILQRHPVRIKVEPSTKVGMRGMVNLGSTCFMNTIMQALLHTPMLRDYFFTDKHRCNGRKTKDCLFCHFAKLFQKYYEDDKSTLSLHEILYLIWQNDPTISGYEQKDAHEFFMSALNLLHQHSSTPTHSTSNYSVPNTQSIVDLIFHGKVQSDVVCQACGNVSTKIDPFSDVSLDIPEIAQTDADLFQCLHHFTRAEVLDSSAGIHCATCQSFQECTKQLTFRLLPVVIVIQLKRFEHVNAKHKKKSQYVSFPTELDMSPYTSKLRNQTNIKKCTHSISDNRYALYAVVVHLGRTLHTGHYLAYIRRTKQTWYKCTDVQVVPADSSEVMASEAYLLFYHKTVLAYR